MKLNFFVFSLIYALSVSVVVLGQLNQPPLASFRCGASFGNASCLDRICDGTSQDDTCIGGQTCCLPTGFCSGDGGCLQSDLFFVVSDSDLTSFATCTNDAQECPLPQEQCCHEPSGTCAWGTSSCTSALASSWEQLLLLETWADHHASQEELLLPNQRCGPYHLNAACASTQCCSAYGYCDDQTSTSEACPSIDLFMGETACQSDTDCAPDECCALDTQRCATGSGCALASNGSLPNIGNVGQSPASAAETSAASPESTANIEAAILLAMTILFRL